MKSVKWKKLKKDHHDGEYLGDRFGREKKRVWVEVVREFPTQF